MIKKIGISGIGFVGGAIYNFFKNTKIEIILYDKFKNEYVNNLENMLDTELLFLCLQHYLIMILTNMIKHLYMKI